MSDRAFGTPFTPVLSGVYLPKGQLSLAALAAPIRVPSASSRLRSGVSILLAFRFYRSKRKLEAYATASATPRLSLEDALASFAESVQGFSVQSSVNRHCFFLKGAAWGQRRGSTWGGVFLSITIGRIGETRIDSPLSMARIHMEVVESFRTEPAGTVVWLLT
jgi:hypothetical protein